MKYQNVKTGRIIDIPSKLKDQEWTPLPAPAKKKTPARRKTVKHE